MNHLPQKSFSLSKISIPRIGTEFFCSFTRRSLGEGGAVKFIARNWRWVFCLSLGVLFFSTNFPLVANAQVATTSNLGLDIIQKPLGLPATDIRIIIANIIKVALSLMGIVLVVMFMYAGYLWMTAGGNDEQIANAKKIIQNATIGLAIVLSAYGIVAFIIRMLGIGAGDLGAGGLNPPGTQNLGGSGALGRIIKDHYPARDQTGVPRNTKIIITFRKPIKVSSLIEDYNKSATDVNNPSPYGDCINIGANMDWQRDCDRLIFDKDHILISRLNSDGTKTPISGANVLAYNENGKFYTFVIRPFETLGSATEEVSYEVLVGNKIQLNDPTNSDPFIFNNYAVGNKFYSWNFTNSTVLDNEPPYVLSVYPNNSEPAVKNSVIQIDFSEAMDPTGLQGTFRAENSYYILQGDSIFLKSGNSTIPLGSFTLTNAYKTLEFTPSIQCATNACGEPIYCLPVCDKVAGACQLDGNTPYDTYSVLVRAATTFSADRFESIPFSGAMDISGNALNSNNNNKVDAVSKLLAVFPTDVNQDSQFKFDNYPWSFVIRDELDLTPPYIRQIAPGLDAWYVPKNSPWEFTFSKRMRIAPFYDGVTIDEKPTPADRGDNIPLWIRPTVVFSDNGLTFLKMNHGPFLDGRREYYFPAVTSVVEDAHFNCLYPGRGPGGANELSQRKILSSVCDEQGNNCCAVMADEPGKSFCCNGLVNQGQQTVADCNAYLQSDGVSPNGP